MRGFSVSDEKLQKEFSSDFIGAYYLYLILNAKIITPSINSTILVIITGNAFIKIPYISHVNAPMQNIMNIPKDISLVDFVLHVWITCGKNAVIVNAEAANPKSVI